MYTEEYERRGFPIKKLLLKLIILIILALLLAWVLPKFNTPVIAMHIDESSTLKSPLDSEVFSTNVERIKKVVISYYTKTKLDQEVQDTATITLKDLMDKKLIGTLADENKKPYDTEKSYIKLTKVGEGYLLKINLKSKQKEDYVLVHLDSYDYCSTEICEKKTPELSIEK